MPFSLVVYKFFGLRADCSSIACASYHLSLTPGAASSGDIDILLCHPAFTSQSKAKVLYNHVSAISADLYEYLYN